MEKSAECDASGGRPFSKRIFDLTETFIIRLQKKTALTLFFLYEALLTSTELLQSLSNFRFGKSSDEIVATARTGLRNN